MRTIRWRLGLRRLPTGKTIVTRPIVMLTNYAARDLSHHEQPTPITVVMCLGGWCQ